MTVAVCRVCGERVTLRSDFELVPGACGRTRIGEMGEDLGAAR